MTSPELKRLERLAKTLTPAGLAGELDELEKMVATCNEKMAQIRAETEMSLGMLSTNLQDLYENKANIKEVNAALYSLTRQPGPQGLPGRDGRDGVSIKGDKGDPGKDGSPDTAEDIVFKINGLPEEPEYQIDAMHIKNLPSPKVQQFGGGLSRMTADLLYQPLGSSSSATPQTPAEAVNGVTQTFTVTAEPAYAVADGVTYFDGAGYTYAALQITFDIIPSSYVRYFL